MVSLEEDVGYQMVSLEEDLEVFRGLTRIHSTRYEFVATVPAAQNSINALYVQEYVV